MVTATEWRTVSGADGRDLEVLVSGTGDGPPLVFHSGTPTAAAALPMLAEPAAQRGLRTVQYSRPGYAASTAQPGRSVADAAADTSVILRALGADRFLTLGWSGGGPHALACAALLPDQCAAAATLAGVAPYDADGLDWAAGMGPENVSEFRAARSGVPVLTAYLEEAARGLAAVTGEEVAAAMGGLVSEVDRESLTGGFADAMAGMLRRAVSTGIAGWRDDDLAILAPWGFDLAAIDVPVAVWQGGQDRMVPFDHGNWLAAQVPSARVHLHPDEGHLSLLAQLPAIMDDLIELAGSR